MKLVDMKLTKAEQKEETREMQAPSAPEYPWGLCLNLEDEQLKKLGLPVPKVGEDVRFAIVCRVKSVSEQRRAEQDDECNVSLQVTAMAVLPEESKPAAKAGGKSTPSLLAKY